MKYRAAFALAAIVSLSGCGINSVPTADENVKARWADVQNDYQRRADLIPNLVAGKGHPRRGHPGARLGVAGQGVGRRPDRPGQGGGV
jgi:hypothetical protein